MFKAFIVVLVLADLTGLHYMHYKDIKWKSKAVVYINYLQASVGCIEKDKVNCSYKQALLKEYNKKQNEYDNLVLKGW